MVRRALRSADRIGSRGRRTDGGNRVRPGVCGDPGGVLHHIRRNLPSGTGTDAGNLRFAVGRPEQQPEYPHHQRTRIACRYADLQFHRGKTRGIHHSRDLRPDRRKSAEDEAGHVPGIRTAVLHRERKCVRRKRQLPRNGGARQAAVCRNLHSRRGPEVLCRRGDSAGSPGLSGAQSAL